MSITSTNNELSKVGVVNIEIYILDTIYITVDIFCSQNGYEEKKANKQDIAN